MPTTSVIYPVQPLDLASVIPYARLAENTSGQRLWCGQSLLVEQHQVFAALAGMGTDLSFGTAVSLMPLRHPLTAAVNAQSTAVLSGRPFIAGIGPGPAQFQKDILGTPYPRPITATRHYITMMRTLLNRDLATSDNGQQMQLLPFPTPPVEIGLGVLREPMARLAGQHADWAITWLTPHTYLHQHITPAIKHAAAQAGRTPPRLAAVVHCIVTRPGRDLPATALRASHMHLRMPHYTNMLNQAGVPVDPTDPQTGAELLVSHGVVATGTPEHIAATLTNYHTAGADEVIINVGSTHIAEGPGAALRDLSAILTAIDKQGQP